MREITFRAKALINDRWVYGYYDVADNIDYIRCKQTGKRVIVDKITLGQKVGLKDCNSKMIFEGDVIRIPDEYDIFGLDAGEKYEVYFSHGGFRMKPKYTRPAKGYYLEKDKLYPVIGNIHDNPGLLEE
jgi:uncharacterized phage protein (TIGR01671 family)